MKYSVKQTLVTIVMTMMVVMIFAIVPLATTNAQKSTTNNSSTTTTSGGDRIQDGLSGISEAFPETVVSKDGDLKDLAKKVIDVALYVAAIVAVIFIIIGGYRYIFSAGSEEGAKAGRKTLLNALIGLAIIVLSYVMVQVVYTFLTKQT